MKDRALSIAKEEKNTQLSINKLREYLQHLILRELFEQDVLNSLVFHGGTALRILFGLRRFSEDLDFHLNDDNGFNFQRCTQKLIQHLTKEGYQLSLKENFQGGVQSAFVKFENLLYEAGLSTQKEEKLSIKIEVDTNPPDGFDTDFSLVNTYFPFGLIHQNRQSFLSGKLHAVLQRSFTKGRDYYDLWFYLSRWKDSIPNLVYLNNALKQTGYAGPLLKEDNWKEVTIKKIKNVDWDYVVSDVDPFLENQNDLRVFKKEIFLNLLK
jgi:predicted nucleotidyltransferase component of viral defense system